MIRVSQILSKPFAFAQGCPSALSLRPSTSSRGWSPLSRSHTSTRLYHRSEDFPQCRDGGENASSKWEVLRSSHKTRGLDTVDWVHLSFVPTSPDVTTFLGIAR